MGLCGVWSVYLATLLLGRLSVCVEVLWPSQRNGVMGFYWAGLVFVLRFYGPDNPLGLC